MAEIRPFRAIRYNPARIADMLKVVTPPYDVIDDELQDTLYRRSPYNFVRLDLTRVDQGESDPLAKYRVAAETLEQWLQEGILVRDDKPALYVYHQTFDDHGQKILRKGVITTVRVHDYADKVVLPHERTLRGPKVDRLELMKATHVQMSQIFLLYNDPELRVDAVLDKQCEGTPDVDVTTEDGIHHQLWVVTDPDTLAFVQQALADQQLLIADGHHRYETAVAFRDLTPAQDAPRPREYAMAYLANGADPGLLVWPTHRALHSVSGFSLDAWLQKLEPWFEITQLQDTDTEATLQKLGEHTDKNAYVVLANQASGARVAYLIVLRADKAEAELAKLDVVDAARHLDVTVLHDFILDRLTGVTREAQAAKTNLHYPRFADEVDEELQDPTTNVVFLMNTTPIDKIREVCVTGGFMPQKSTYFYPKVLSGLVVNSVEDF